MKHLLRAAADNIDVTVQSGSFITNFKENKAIVKCDSEKKGTMDGDQEDDAGFGLWRTSVHALNVLRFVPHILVT